MTTPSRRLQTEFAHILLMDIVGYSKLSLNQQTASVAALRQIVEATSDYQAAMAGGELICLDTGDGMALVFFRDPVAPVQCAVDIARALRSRSHIPLRMGINSGVVTRSEGTTGHPNVYGDGINFAERITSSGGAGDILLSRITAEVLLRLDEWSAHIHDRGEVRVKHNVPLQIFGYYDGTHGNPPSSTGEVLSSQAVTAAPGATPQPVSEPSDALKLAIVYKRNAQPDEYLLNFLERELKAQGFRLFIDRHLTIGVEWAQAIQRELVTADVVIPLLSEAALQSEMLEYEIQTAQNALEKQGKPRLLPVRIGYTDPLTGPLGSVLDRLQYSLWESEADNARLLSELVYAIHHPPAPKPSDLLEAVGGAVPLDSRFYIPRPADADFLHAIRRQDSIVLLKGGRQMGKTSLMARGLEEARQAGARVAFTDFQTLTQAELDSPEAFFMALARSLKLQLDLDVSIKALWDEDLSPNMNLERFLRRSILLPGKEPLVWGLDEVDRLFTCSFGSEVFGLFRSWHNKRATEPSGPWSRLTLAIAYATEAHLFITDINQSPFNVGTRLSLQDFTADQVADLNRRYGSPLRNVEEAARFYRLVNGQPYLTQRGLNTMASQPMDIAALEAQADQDEGLFGDHLRRMLVLLARDDGLMEAVRQILQNRLCPDEERFFRLRSAGIMAGNTVQEARPRCQLYATYLSRHLL